MRPQRTSIRRTVTPTLISTISAKDTRKKKYEQANVEKKDDALVIQPLQWVNQEFVRCFPAGIREARTSESLIYVGKVSTYIICAQCVQW